MRKLFVLLMLFSFTLLLKAQSHMIDNMDSSAVKAKYEQNIEGSKSRIDFTDMRTGMKEGTGALKVNYVVGEYQKWGSYANAIYKAPAGTVMNWAAYDTINLWYKVLRAPIQPQYMVFRMHVGDRSTPDASVEEFIYENTTILDATSDWVLLKIPFYERIQNESGDLVPNTEGFTLFPTTWGGGNYNNRQLDLDKIFQFNLSAVVTGWDPNANLPADSVEVVFDRLELTGARAVPYVLFNGKVMSSALGTGWSWGQSAMSIEDNAGPSGKEKAIKWVHGDEWANGWTGIGWDISPAFNMAGSFIKDSLQFQYKAEPGIGELRAQFESAAGKSGKLFTPIADNAWHTLKLALKDFTFRDAAPAADSTVINKFGFMTQGTATASKGKAIFITYMWTGHPVVDVVAPEAVTNLVVTKQTNYNTITWSDVPNETGETYFVYASKSPITDVRAKNVEVVKSGLAKSVGTADHLLFSPATDQSQTYYYAVVCQDAAGNESVAALTGLAITNTAKGVATVTVGAPVNFKADGDLTEWYGYVNPFLLFPSKGVFWSPTVKANTGDNDLSVTSFLYIDANNLYVAFDVTDDYVFPTQMANSYENDSPDLFIGLYDSRGAKHNGGLKSGKEPDYHFRFNKDAVRTEGGGKDKSTLILPGIDYSWTEKTFPGSGYVVEARIPFSLLMSSFKDTIYVKQGSRMPIDFSINDNDDGTTRRAIMCYSKDNQDQSWGHVEFWTYSFLGNVDGVITSTKEESTLPIQFSLSQNYPNPFNPTTSIKYSIQKSGFVSLKVYDILGRQVAELVNKQQEAGSYNISFDASRLTSGVYLYKIESGSFISTKKMMLVK